VFRTSSGELAAVADECPHRRLKLSAGRVAGDRIECRYHGWAFGPDGAGESPGSPKLTACVASFDAQDRHGLVWVKARGPAAPVPDLDPPGYVHVGTLRHVVPAPLELTLDNFNEIEHSGTVHARFGYDLDRMGEVRVRFEPASDAVRVVNAGPTKRLPWWVRLVLGVRRGDLFHDDWTTRFSPLHSVFDHWWTSADGTRERMVRWRLYVFYTPVDADSTLVTSVTYARSRYPGPGGGVRLLRWLLRREIDREIAADADTLRHLADRSPSVAGMRLSRFDKVLGLVRERLDRVYRASR
jgi:phenylpropionate dioxygenase-like ring-hydroxylating dioxygenase large terminal subunit